MLRSCWYLGNLIGRSVTNPAPASLCAAASTSLFSKTTMDWQTIRGFAARKGTRTRKSKQKVKKEVVKTKFMFKQLKKQALLVYEKQKPVVDTSMDEPVDNVYYVDMFRKIGLPFEETMKCIKSSHDPSFYNCPHAEVIAKLEFDLIYPKRPNKFMDSWRSVVEMSHPFDIVGVPKPSILAFCPEDNAFINDVIKSGADQAGSKEMIKAIQNGDINTNDFEYIICHPSVLQDLTTIRGVIKKKFPSLRTGTLGTDLPKLVSKLKAGVKVKLEINSKEPDYGFIEVIIGMVDMPIEGLEANLINVVKDSIDHRVKGKQPSDFLLQVSLRTSYDPEIMRVDFKPYILDMMEPSEPSHDSYASKIEAVAS